MGFEMLLGNERLRENISRSIRQGHISHFYLISGPEGSGKHTLARLLAAAIHCTEENKPCMRCAGCRKVMANTHPDFITVEDPERKTVPVKTVRQARDDMYVRPNEAERKIYMFPQELGIEGQNALLKILEEPPAYGVFFLLTDNPEKLLPTIRSRCTELKLVALPEALLRSNLQARFPDASAEDIQGAVARSGGYLGQAVRLLEEGNVQCPHTEQFIRCFTARDTMGLVSLLVPMERWKRDQFLPVLTRWEEALHSALVCRSGIHALSADVRQLSISRSSKELLSAIRHIQKALDYARGNVSVAAICGYLLWALQ